MCISLRETTKNAIGISARYPNRETNLTSLEYHDAIAATARCCTVVYSDPYALVYLYSVSVLCGAVLHFFHICHPYDFLYFAVFKYQKVSG